VNQSRSGPVNRSNRFGFRVRLGRNRSSCRRGSGPKAVTLSFLRSFHLSRHCSSHLQALEATTGQLSTWGDERVCMGTLCTATGVESSSTPFARRRHVNLMFDAHSASMARWEERAAVQA